jgi:hypothetical protein
MIQVIYLQVIISNQDFIIPNNILRKRDLYFRDGIKNFAYKLGYLL